VSIPLLSGIGFVPVTIGLFGIGEILASAEESGIGFVERLSARLGLRDLFEALGELRKRIVLVLANSLIGFAFGALPGHGATAASFLGYGLARAYWGRLRRRFLLPKLAKSWLLPQNAVNPLTLSE